MGKRDDHAVKHFAAARDMLRYESVRLSNIFGAFLLANTVFIGSLLHAATSGGGFPAAGWSVCACPAVVFDGEDQRMRVRGLARLEIRNAGRVLILLFIVVY